MSYQAALSLSELPTVGAVRVMLNGNSVAVVRAEDGTVHAVADTCSHAEVSLSEGEVEGCAIECWLHGSRFDLRSGEPTGLPATQPIDVYPVRIDGEDILVDVTAPLTTTKEQSL
ncbi:MAG: non-heme iron oxygenase ferredoxin subunit [Actinomycetota bacterium]